MRETDVDTLRSIAGQVMSIEDTTLGDGAQFAVRFRGRLARESAEAYAFMAERFKPLGYTPIFRLEGGAHVVSALPVVFNARPARSWINLLMAGLTIVSVLMAGALYGYDGPLPPELTEVSESIADDLAAIWAVLALGFRNMINGWPLAASILSILIAHEFGHYFAARFHKVQVSLPYFIPFPLSPFGTMGAVIQLKSPPTNKRVLLDIGLAGPLAGFVVAVPVLLYGLATSPLDVVPANQLSGFEGNSILYALFKFVVFGRWLPEPASFGGLPGWLYMLRFYALGFPVPAGGTDVFLNQVAWGGWAGLLITGLNLIPAGQLDGGHALYTLVGRRATRLVPIITVLLVGLGFVWVGWFLWAAIVFFLGRAHAEPLDQITELGPRRRVLAIGALVLFLLTITPVPLR